MKLISITTWQNIFYNLLTQGNTWVKLLPDGNSKRGDTVTTINLDKVRDYMKKKEYSEPEMATNMGITYSYFFRVMRGDRQPGGKFISGLIAAGMAPEEIFLPQVLPKGKTGTHN